MLLSRDLPPVRISLRLKLAGLLAAIALLAGGLPSAWAILQARAAAHARVEDQLTQLASTIATGGLFADGRGHIDTRALRAFVHNAPQLRLPLVYVVSTDPAGTIREEASAVNETALAEVAPELSARLTQGERRAVLEALAARPLPSVHSIAVKLQSAEGQALGGLQIGMSSAEADRRAQAAFLQSGAIVATVILVVLGLSLVASGRLVRPLRQLAAAMSEVAAGNLDQEVPSTSGDEVGLIAAAFNQMTQGLRQRERLKSTLGRYVSEEVADRILSESHDLNLHGELRAVTVLFLDVRGFSTLAERLEPPKVVELLNAYFDLIVEAIDAEHGIINKFIGDAVMAVWGAPGNVADPEMRAVRAAWEIQRRVGEYNWTRLQEGKEVVNVGIGINTGVAVAGNIGSEKRLEYTVIGHDVNMAQRLESLAEPGQILLGPETYARVSGRVECVALPAVRVKGRREPMTPWQVVNLREDA